MNPPKRSLQEIWRLGCAGEAHQSRGQKEAATWIALLIKGLVRELRENPGLERLWQTTTVADSKHGKAVSFELQKVLP